MNAKVQEMVSIIREKTDFVPKVALTLGSGLGNFADEINVVCEIPYSDLPDFPVSTVEGHDGRFIMGYLDQVPIICMKGRVHLYEGYTPSKTVLPIRVMRALGAEILFLTNAAGGINPRFYPGALAMITDQISIFAPNPLLGPNDDDEGVRFPDMTNAYDPSLRQIIREIADRENIDLQEGVYAQLTGPSFETPAEIRLLKALDVDLVGMSTVVENIVANHMGMRVCALSLVSNMAAGISKAPLSHQEVQEAARKASVRFTTLVRESIRAFAGQL